MNRSRRNGARPRISPVEKPRVWQETCQSLHSPIKRVLQLGSVVIIWMSGLSGVGPVLSCELSVGRESQNVVYVRHLGADCSALEREQQAVASQDLLRALKDGQGVDLQGVLVTGDLSLDAVPVASDEQMRKLPVAVRDWIARQGTQDIRLVRGGIAIRDSTVRGSITHRSKQGYLLIEGPVTMAGTRFEGFQDWSRVIFLGPVDWSGAEFAREGFFVQDRFWHDATFDRTTFSGRSRFHRAHFQEAVSFREATFNGLAELLEVTFQGPARFAGARFTQGSGFSGSHFHSVADFSRSLFEREVYFMFTVFEQPALFRGAGFRSVNSYADAEFNGTGDFSTAVFEQAPEFMRTKFKGERLLPSSGSASWPVYLPVYLVAAVAVIFTLLILKQTYRSRSPSSRNG
ncbi:hypothetical protein DNFV4_01765 [Nitrospira tepida]|uniref:Pentapeptide repeat-containing protein n=2 Tax=Nitrospira tepida TaxID=2973512 RepID=A0AA86T484_9BACT|nr:hypothetical protein DNFV4_01765 [Nitrospira tepida]